MKSIWLFFLFFCRLAFGQGISIELEPKIPTAGERFDLIFLIKMSGNRAPEINFSHQGLELLGRRSGGVSLNTTIINGKVSTSKEVTLAYSLLAKNPGIYQIKDVKVNIDGSVLSYAPFEIEVLKERKEASGFFLLAIPSKTKIYLGEGIEVNYYLYFQPSIRVAAESVEDFPKFEKFIKRYHNIQSNVESATSEGAVFYRKLIYSARLFPEKLGSLSIDPMKIAVQYYDSQRDLDSLGVFGAFGFSAARSEQKIISSKQIAIQVQAPPNPPQEFTGLIGVHDFKIEAKGQKVLVNEPIEIKFTVEGPGALENFDAPKLYQHDLLEEFDSKSEITETSLSHARKTFSYTYLPKGPFEIQPQEKIFYFFDPQTGKYVSKKILLPPIKVGGVNIKSFSSGDHIVVRTSEGSDGKMLAPYFLLSAPTSPNTWYNIFLSIVIFAVLVEILYRKWSKNGLSGYYLDLCKALRNRGPNYSILHKLLLPLDKNSMEDSLLDILDNSSLSESAKEYFKKLVEISEKKSYGKESFSFEFIYQEKFFKELVGILKSK